MNTKGYLGLNKKYAYALRNNYRHLTGPYEVDKKLREKKIVKDHSFNTNFEMNNMAINFLNPLQTKDNLFFEISIEEYNHYKFIRNNAFYTPYGMMVLLDNPYFCKSSFTLEDGSLIPEERHIEIIGTNLNSPKYRSEYYAAFFADFVMEKIILKFFLNNHPNEGWFSDKVTDVHPVLMKRYIQSKEVPAYDVQFNDLIAFSDQLSYDTYMMALTSYLTGHQINGDHLSFRFNPTDRILKCYANTKISISLNGANLSLMKELDRLWKSPVVPYEQKRQISYKKMNEALN